MTWTIERYHSAGTGVWVQHFASYQAALDELAAMYSLPSSAWGPSCIVSKHHEHKHYVHKVADSDSQPTYLFSQDPRWKWRDDYHK